MSHMSTLFDDIEKRAKLLSQPEKALLARILVGELDANDDADVERLWVAESQRRYSAYLEGSIESHPGDEVVSRVRRRLQ